MTDREALMIAYGRLTALETADALTKDIRDHLFGDKPSERAPTFSEWATSYRAPSEGEGIYKTSIGEMLNIHIPQPSRSERAEALAEIVSVMSSPPEPTTPGEYRLRRSFIGVAQMRLGDCNQERLRQNIMRYKADVMMGKHIHPDVALDVAAAERYLESIK